MDIRNIAVALEADAIDLDLIALASDLARHHGAALIGIVAAEIPVIAMGMEGGDVAGVVYAERMKRIEEAFAAARDLFETNVPPTIKRRWVEGVRPWHAAVADEACSADLILVSQPSERSASGYFRDVASLLLAAGRPILIAAEGQRTLRATKVVIAWKDTKEARRAIADAMPFIKAASEVAVVVVDEGNLAAERTSMQAVVSWLGSHGVTVHGDVLPGNGGAARTVIEAARALGADLIVGGAYGHSRMREWLLGGVTRDLLAAAHVNRLLSN